MFCALSRNTLNLSVPITSICPVVDHVTAHDSVSGLRVKCDQLLESRLMTYTKMPGTVLRLEPQYRARSVPGASPYSSSAYSCLAATRMGRSESASFQRSKKDSYMVRLPPESPICLNARARPSCAIGENRDLPCARSITFWNSAAASDGRSAARYAKALR